MKKILILLLITMVSLLKNMVVEEDEFVISRRFDQNGIDIDEIPERLYLYLTDYGAHVYEEPIEEEYDDDLEEE